jgi:hypothetical protein
MARAKTWKEKLEIDRKPEVVQITKGYAGIPAGSRVLVSTPKEVDRFIRKIPEGTFVSPEELRKKLAARHGADAACPLATGIFLRIAAEAAWEQMQKDEAGVTPFWRVVPPGSNLAKKLTCGDNFVRKMQSQEGIAAPCR